MHPLYMNDCYLREFPAVVQEASVSTVVLDNTAFYPAGGGVPCDIGWITKNGSKIEVVNVAKENGRIIHHLSSSGGLSSGDTVTGLIDWNRRYILMRHHTSAHLLAAMFYNELGVLITGNQLGVEQSRMDFSMENFDRQSIEKAFDNANEMIKENRPVKIYYLNRKDAMKIPGIVKLANALPPSVDELRIVEISGIDVQADGGCHVRSLSEIGSIELLRMENKGKSNRRVYYSVK